MPMPGLFPSPGRISALRRPSGPGIRDDSGVEAGGEVPTFYDPMISKLIAWGEDRLQATARMRRALDEYEVIGIRTSIPFFRWMLRQPAFASAAFHTGYLDELLQQRAGEPFSAWEPSVEEVAAIAAALHAMHRTNDRRAARSPAGAWKQQARVEGCGVSAP
jgi:acetyl/propionyl-CoA carboxylase alpha subunit